MRPESTYNDDDNVSVSFQWQDSDGARQRINFEFLPVHSDMAVYMTEFAAEKFFVSGTYLVDAILA